MSEVVVVRGLDEVEPARSVVTIGNFDGVHRGHHTLLRRARDTAADARARAVAVTFDPHPAAVLRPGSEPALLQTLEDRTAEIGRRGMDLVVVLPFTPELASLPPERFVADVLVERLRAVRVVVGSNFRFGHRAAGDLVTLVEEGERHGFTTEAITLLEVDGEPISSSAIRSHLTAGELDWVSRALGRPYTLTGEVVAGEGRGRTIGVPTANVAVPDRLSIPGDGVYACHAELDGRRLAAVVNVGRRPTFGGDIRSVEAHLLDVEVEAYGRRLTLAFEHRIRSERRFDGPDELVAQIRDDIETARSLLLSSRTAQDTGPA